jgi:two-component system sensor histidine kinase/response regulator
MTQRITSEPARVLLVDDDQALLDALPNLIGLRIPGTIVDVCDSAPQAAQQVRSNDYDAIITDIKMPVMDGLTLLSEVRSVRPDTPVLLLTGHGEHDLTIQALRRGAFDFLVKPIDREYFTAALSRALDMRALRRQVKAQQTELEMRARMLEETVERRTEELVRANEAKDEFLGLISHEMRTPLTILSGGLQVLRSRTDTLPREDRDGLMQDLVHESERLTRMVEDLLVLARSESYVIRNPEPISVVPMLRKLATRMEPVTDRVIHIEAAEGLPLVAGDLTFLERIIENLISNAVKYSQPPASVEIGASAREDGQVAITVSDHGIGVADSEINRIFDSFYRSNESSAAVAGHGVGLAVCKRLVEALSGTIAANHREGGGLEVSFTVPAYDETAASEAELMEEMATV